MIWSKFYRIAIPLLSLLLLPSVLVAQQQGEREERCPRREELAKLRRDFFTRELDLTVEEANHLDRILAESERKEIPLWRAIRDRQDVMNKGHLTKEQETISLEREQELKAQLDEIEEQTLKELHKYIPAHKLMNYHQARRKFPKKYIARGSRQSQD